MMNKNERMNKLNAAGVDTSKYFNVTLPEGLAPGSTISLVINENGEPVFVRDMVNNDPIAKEIIEDGYVRNSKLHRRFVMAQMFRALNYVSYDGMYVGYNDCINHSYGYNYTFDMMLEEIRVLSKLEVRDKETFEERAHFFTKEVVAAVMEDYLEKLVKHIDTLAIHKCKGVPYKKIKGTNIFVADIDKKIYLPIKFKISDMKRARNYAEMYRILSGFMNKRTFIKLPYNTPKSKVWMDAYKGEGAYYTCKNLIMFHDCNVHNGTMVYSTTGSMRVLGEKLNEYKTEGWRMFAFMKKLIADNHFNFDKRMSEIYDN